MAEERKSSKSSDKDKEIKAVYRSERKKQRPHLIDEEERRQIEKEKKLLVEQVQFGDIEAAIGRRAGNTRRLSLYFTAIQKSDDLVAFSHPVFFRKLG